MIDVDAFYAQLGATQSLGADEQLVLAGEVRVFCAQDGWTAVFEAMSPSDDRLDAAFEICRQEGGLVPFTTRSGPLAVKRPCPGEHDETAQALNSLRTVMRYFGQGGTAEPA